MRESRVPIPCNVRLEVHLVPTGIHHGEGVVFILVVAKPRIIGQAREDELPTLAVRLGAAVTFLRLDEPIAGRAENVGEVLVAFTFGKLGDLDGRAGAADRLVWREEGWAGGRFGSASATAARGMG